MSLKYILDRVVSEAGISSPDLNPEQRAAIVDKINEAAEEIYEKQDYPGCLRECFVRVTANMRVSLPPFIGQLRAIRHATAKFNYHWSLNDMRPRFTGMDWPNKWNKWRVIGDSPTALEFTNTAPGNIIYPVVDDELTITLIGETLLSNRQKDSVVCSVVNSAATPLEWTSNFLSFSSIKKSKVTDYNVLIKDADENEIAIIYADQLESRFMIVDVSQYPNISCGDCADGTYTMEVLYKARLPRLERDDDEFPVRGYDNVIVLKTKQLLAEDRPGEEQRAILMHQKAQEKEAHKVEDATGTIVKKIQFKPNKLLGLYDRYRTHSRRFR